jgi:hypothetical protein
MDFIYSMELYELIASSLFFGFTLTLVGAWIALSHAERKLDRADQEKFADEYGIPYWVRATDEQIGITNR